MNVVVDGLKLLEGERKTTFDQLTAQVVRVEIMTKQRWEEERRRSEEKERVMTNRCLNLEKEMERMKDEMERMKMKMEKIRVTGSGGEMTVRSLSFFILSFLSFSSFPPPYLLFFSFLSFPFLSFLFFSRLSV